MRVTHGRESVLCHAETSQRVPRKSSRGWVHNLSFVYDFLIDPVHRHFLFGLGHLPDFFLNIRWSIPPGLSGLVLSNHSVSSITTQSLGPS